jgi:hypothetical protein
MYNIPLPSSYYKAVWIRHFSLGLCQKLVYNRRHFRPYDGRVGGTTAMSRREAPTMTEAQARAKLQKLLAVTLERGAAPGEQANATRAIGAILQEHPSLRDMILGVEGTAMSHPPAGVWSQENMWAFWQGVLLGVGTAVSTVGVVVLSHLFNRGNHS